MLLVSVSAGHLKDCAHKQGTDTCTQRAFLTLALSTSLLCCRFCLWKHAQCTEHSTRRWIVCGSPGVLPCSTCWQPLRVKPLPVTQLLDHRLFPQICSNASCFAWDTALRGIRRILDLLVMTLQALSTPPCAPVETLNLGPAPALGSNLYSKKKWGVCL